MNNLVHRDKTAIGFTNFPTGTVAWGSNSSPIQHHAITSKPPKISFSKNNRESVKNQNQHSAGMRLRQKL